MHVLLNTCKERKKPYFFPKARRNYVKRDPQKALKSPSKAPSLTNANYSSEAPTTMSSPEHEEPEEKSSAESSFSAAFKSWIFFEILSHGLNCNIQPNTKPVVE